MIMPLIKVTDVEYTYQNNDSPVKAVDGISMEINDGEFIAVLGRNGSGKSTLARMLNALILPDKGNIVVLEMDSSIEDNVWSIRKNIGMIFQNPDNQIVGTTVIEDVAFGPENLGVEPVEIKKRAIKALDDIGILKLKERAPHLLSGGQKQKVAIAGVLAMKPRCIILDESTSMLDPVGRHEVLETIQNLNKIEKISIVHITHHMEEACLADRVIIVDNGKLVAQGTPEEVFSDVDGVQSLGLDVPQVTKLMYELKKLGIVDDNRIISVDAAAERLGSLIG
ncbi:MAG: energy-coupling factor transporter ATPase [Clostridiales bacterium]|nr:energy-coupling factor transporter ATPase [Clostridiales bacterium]